MEPETHLPEDKSDTHKKLRLFIIVGVIFFVLALGVFYVVVIRGGGSAEAGFRSLFPFGEATDTGIPDGTTGGGKLDDVSIEDGGDDTLPRMWKIADGPVSGATFKTLPDGILAVRYVLREDGDIYEHSVFDRTNRLLANNTVPRVAEAVWDARGQSVVLRTASDEGDILSVLGKLLPNPGAGAGDEAPAILEQSFLRENISFIVPGPNEGFVHTLRTGSELSIVQLDGQGQVTPIFTSPFTEWIPEWASEDSVGLTTRPSGVVGGYFFTLDPKTGRATPIINDFLGLTTKGAPDGDHVFVGGLENNILEFGIISKASPTLNVLVPATLPEKCAWTASSTLAYCGVPQNPPRALYPDEWYQGIIQFSDTLWVYDMETDQFTLFLIPSNEAGVEVDVTNPVINASGEYLIFTNKRDGSLWGVRLEYITL